MQYEGLTFLNLASDPFLSTCILNRVTKEIVPIATQSKYEIYTSMYVSVENAHVLKTKQNTMFILRFQKQEAHRPHRSPEKPNNI